MEKIHLKFIDDTTMAESIHLKEHLVQNPDLVHPTKYHERTGHVLPKGVSKVQDALDDLVIYTRDHQMQLNKEKT